MRDLIGGATRAHPDSIHRPTIVWKDAESRQARKRRPRARGSGGERSDRRVVAFPAVDVVARDRHRVDAARELDLPDHEPPAPEAHLTAGEVELPHPHEALVVDPLRLALRRHEAAAP